MSKVRPIPGICLVMIDRSSFKRLSRRIRERFKGPFIRNVTMLATGTAASQAITMMFAPLITRLYGPEAYGLQGVFMSVIGLLTTFAALGYPTAIVLQRNDENARSIAKLSVLVGVVITVLVSLVLAYHGKTLLSIFNAENVADYIFLVPAAMIFSVLGAILSQWWIRKNEFRISAIFGVIATLTISGAKAIVGTINPSAAVLIYTNVIGGMLSTIFSYLGWKYISKSNRGNIFNEPSQTKGIKELAITHLDFPLLRTPQNIINVVSQSLPIFLLTSLFGPASAGQYAIALTVLGLPGSLIAGSVMSVFYPKVTGVIHQGGDAYSLIVKATMMMAIVGVLPFSLVIFAGPVFFEMVFGDEWRTAGLYAQILSAWLFLQFINKPAVAAVPALGIQGGLLIYEIFSTGAKVAALWVGFDMFGSETAALVLFSISGILSYIYLIIWVMMKAKKYNRKCGVIKIV